MGLALEVQFELSDGRAQPKEFRNTILSEEQQQRTDSLQTRPELAKRGELSADQLAELEVDRLALVRRPSVL